MPKLTKELVVNWHITEACNYKCDYCFAKWDSDSKEVLHSQIKIETLIEQIESIRHILNKSSQTVYFDQLRLNLVGGETFLYGKQLKNIINLAKKYNFRLSAISNGSLFNEIDMKFIAQNFSSLGISVDSINEYTNLAIGRTSKQNTFNPSQVLTAINKIKKYNPMIEIKINTVVNKLNASEDLSYFISQIQPNKWKIFKLLPVYSNKLDITEQEFHQFIEKHSNFKSIISSENNNDMTESYLMIDPLGRFFQNGYTSGYKYSSPLWQVSAETALKQIKFDSQKFVNRYKKIF